LLRQAANIISFNKHGNNPVGRAVYGRGHIEARTDTTQQSGQTPDKEVEIKNITVYASGYTVGPDSRGR